MIRSFIDIHLLDVLVQISKLGIEKTGRVGRVGRVGRDSRDSRVGRVDHVDCCYMS